MVTHILHPTDFSEASQASLDLVKKLASKYSAKITLLHVYDTSLTMLKGTYMKDIHYFDELGEFLENRSNKMLSELKIQLENEGLNASTLAIDGHAGQDICKVAEQEKCNLIVMGRRGMSGLQKMLLGSASNYVLHHAKVPVLIVPDQK